LTALKLSRLTKPSWDPHGLLTPPPRLNSRIAAGPVSRCRERGPVPSTLEGIMKKSLAVMVVVGAVVVVGAAFANDGGKIRANVPFEFYVGTEVLPAGAYQFEMRSLARGSASASTVIVSNADGRVLALRMSVPGSANPETAQLHFLRYGTTCFLTRVEGLGLQADLIKSPVESKLIAQGNAANGVLLIAAK